ncbi:histidine kinase N-terminal 7TM domain-containing protein [Anaeroselena agilis]|uniref:histidine kinase n=1 Tax=Anaeroselena agilis TaxID=3063788 RepID=A0ABU3P4Q6_9FIRM|nr:histidine kinase N-terminal 7TM domain-containing protein [Selenomonadales bacterium 4137-cl]
MNVFSSQAGWPASQVLIYHPIQDIWIYLLAAAVLLSLSVYTWRYRQSPPALYLALGSAARVVWLVALVMITVSPALADKLRWAVIHQLGALAVIPVALMTALHLTGQRPVVIRAARVFLLAITGFFWLAVLTGGWHDWYWRGLPWDVATFGFIRGPLFWTAMIIGYLTLAVTLALYIHRAVRTSGLRRWQALAVPADMVISAAGHILWITGPSTSFALPLGFLLGSLVWFAIFFGLRVFDLQELAEATVTRDMNDCLIVTDAQDYIVELNPAAEVLFREQAAAMAGRRAAAAFAPWPALAALAESGEARAEEIAVAGGHYLARVSLLTGWGGRHFGKAIVLQDIGELKKAQARIIEQEKALSIMAERDRLGRELHDGPGQVWNYLSLKLQTVDAFLTNGQSQLAKQEIAGLIGTVGQMNADARASIVGLKLAGDTGDDFIAKLRDYLAWYRESTGLAVELALPPDWTEKIISRFREVQLLRIIQEALTNVRKHAGAARVRVGIEKIGKRAVVLVEDDGCGFDMTALTAGKSSFGLRIMAERAAEAGGQLEIESKVGRGTKVIVRFDPEGKV